RRHTRWPRDWSSDVCSSDLDVFSLALALVFAFAFSFAFAFVFSFVLVFVLAGAVFSLALPLTFSFVFPAVPDEQAASIIAAAIRSEERRVGKECMFVGDRGD